MAGATAQEDVSAAMHVDQDAVDGLDVPKARFEGGWRSPLLSHFSDLDGRTSPSLP